MKRLCGRHKTLFHVLLILKLDDEALYGIADIVKTYVQPSADPITYKRVYQAVHDFVDRNHLKARCDNYVEIEGRPRLNEAGERVCLNGRFKKWYGRHLKAQLYEDDLVGLDLFRQFLSILQVRQETLRHQERMISPIPPAFAPIDPSEPEEEGAF